MKIVIPILLSLILCACGAPAAPLDESGSDGNIIEVSLAEPSENDVEQLYTEILTKDGYTLSVSGRIDGDTLTFRLLSPSSGYDKTVQITEFDGYVETLMLYDYNSDVVEVDLNIQDETAVVIMKKNRYVLNFANEKYTFEIEYRMKDLVRLIDKSIDGKYEIHEIYGAFGGEYVVVDTETQDIWHLANWTLYRDAIFCGENAVLINQWLEPDKRYSLELLDLHTGEPLPNAPQFEYGESEQEENRPKYYTTGIAYDHTQKKTLVAYRNSDPDTIEWKPTHNVYIAVFDESGKQINTIDTGFMMQPFVSSYLNTITFEHAENGEAVISAFVSPDSNYPSETTELGRINY